MFDQRQSMADDPLVECPNCEELQLRKVINPPGIVFKGSGFYVTDNRNGAKGKASSTSSSAEKSSTDSDSGSSSDSKSENAKSASTESSSAKGESSKKAAASTE